MESVDFTDFIGHNYAAPAVNLQHQLHIGPNVPVAGSLDTNEVIGELSPQQVTSITKVSAANDKFTAENGALKFVDADVNIGDISNSQEQPAKSWSAVVAQSVPNTQTSEVPNVAISYNLDGSSNINPTKEFLLNARKQWESSFIGHFIGVRFNFTFIKEQAMKMWKNKGLMDVYFSPRGYYTFRFKTVAEKDALLHLNSVQIGGKNMYLMPWMEGTALKTNVVTKVPCWIRLVDVPLSYWSKDGLSSLAKVVGKTLKFDVSTARFKPMKYAGVQVELEYGGHRPPYVWAPVINCNGENEKMKVEILYPPMPYSCSLCKAFGHSLSRCHDNPEAVKRQTRPARPNRGGVGNSRDTEPKGQAK